LGDTLTRPSSTVSGRTVDGVFAERSGAWQKLKLEQWVTAEIVVQVRFLAWTAEGGLRHAAFVGVRPDKEAS
jgi:ATP-dependent DNA ligase